MTDIFPIMKLPRELRDQIYRELLLVDKTGVDEQNELRSIINREHGPLIRSIVDTKAEYGLTPALLQVCKQIHGESHRILYRENTWVLFRFGDERWDQVNGESGRKTLSGDQIKQLAGMFALRIATFGVKPFVNVLASLKRFRSICLNMMFDFPRSHIAIHLYFGHMLVPGGKVQQRLLEDLQDLRGIQSVVVEGKITDEAKLGLITSMIKPIQYLSELIDRANAYRCQGHKEAAAGRFLEAEQTYLRAWEYPITNESRTRRHLQWMLGLQKDKPTWFKFVGLRQHIRFEYARCMIRNGKTNSVPRILSAGFKPRGRADWNYVDTGYNIGAALMIRDFDFEAAHLLTEVLRLQTDHRGAYLALEAIEAKNTSTQTPEAAEVRSFLARDDCKNVRQGIPINGRSREGQ